MGLMTWLYEAGCVQKVMRVFDGHKRVFIVCMGG